MDPITAIAVATKAFATVKAMVAAGREVEDTLSQIGAWYGAASDFAECKRQADNPPLFRKIVSSKSVEQEAIDIYARGKRLEQQERELRELLLYTYGPTGYQEMIDLRRSIREQREKMVYAQARRRKAFFWNSVTLIAISVLSYVTFEMYSFLVGKIFSAGT